jgi:hypothetical protein
VSCSERRPAPTILGERAGGVLLRRLVTLFFFFPLFVGAVLRPHPSRSPARQAHTGAGGRAGGPSEEAARAFFFCAAASVASAGREALSHRSARKFAYAHCSRTKKKPYGRRLSVCPTNPAPTASSSPFFCLLYFITTGGRAYIARVRPTSSTTTDLTNPHFQLP